MLRKRVSKSRDHSISDTGLEVIFFSLNFSRGFEHLQKKKKNLCYSNNEINNMSLLLKELK